jgi:hypothetical protein
MFAIIVFTSVHSVSNIRAPQKRKEKEKRVPVE